MLETSECVLIYNTNNRSYTDCMEWTLLRFMQLMLYNYDTLSDQKMSYFVENLNLHQDILNFIEKNNMIYVETDYYETSIGKNERTEWVKLLSDYDNLFDYYRNDKAELFTNVNNILLFYKYFFNCNLIDLNESSQYNFNIIAKYLGQITNKNISFEISEINSTKKIYKMQQLCAMLSKEDKNLTNPNIQHKLFSAINKITNIKIKINEENYLWTLMEYYLDDSYTQFNNKFITGHSVINKLS